MNCTIEDIMCFLKEHDVQFIRLSYCDIFGCQKNISVRPNQIEHILKNGLFIHKERPEEPQLLLVPDLSSFDLLPWRPQTGSVVRFFCQICHQGGEIWESDCRSLLRKQLEKSRQDGYEIKMQLGTSFYLFKKDGTEKIPLDNAGYLDVSPLDQGEDIRRQVCLNLDDMGIETTVSYHDRGPGQNSIDLTYQDILTACDQFVTLKWTIQTSAELYDLETSFDRRPCFENNENTMHIRFQIPHENGSKIMNFFYNGIVKHYKEIELFLHATSQSYQILNKSKCCLLSMNDIEILSVESNGHPYLISYLLLMAGLDGIAHQYDQETIEVPESLDIAIDGVQSSSFIQDILPSSFLNHYVECLTKG